LITDSIQKIHRPSAFRRRVALGPPTITHNDEDASRSSQDMRDKMKNLNFE